MLRFLVDHHEKKENFDSGNESSGYGSNYYIQQRLRLTKTQDSMIKLK